MSTTIPMAIQLAPNGILSVAQFRLLISAFSNSAIYQDDTISMYLTIAASMLDPNRWADWRPMGMAMMVAHWLSLDAREAKTAAAGGIPGQSGLAILTSKGIGPVSAGYDVRAGDELNAGNWNLTTFGKRYIHMARLVGAGGVQITGAVSNNNPTDRRGPIF